MGYSAVCIPESQSRWSCPSTVLARPPLFVAARSLQGEFHTYAFSELQDCSKTSWHVTYQLKKPIVHPDIQASRRSALWALPGPHGGLWRQLLVFCGLLLKLRRGRRHRRQRHRLVGKRPRRKLWCAGVALRHLLQAQMTLIGTRRNAFSTCAISLYSAFSTTRHENPARCPSSPLALQCKVPPGSIDSQAGRVLPAHSHTSSARRAMAMRFAGSPQRTTCATSADGMDRCGTTAIS